MGLIKDFPKDPDYVIDTTDKALNAALKALLPLTAHMEAGEITEAFIRTVETHMTVELCAMYNGPQDPEYCELSDGNKRLSQQFRAKRKNLKGNQ